MREFFLADGAIEFRHNAALVSHVSSHILFPLVSPAAQIRAGDPRIV